MNTVSCKTIWQKFRFSFTVKLCPKDTPYAYSKYSDGDMCCSELKELKDGGHSSEFAWKYLCEKNKDNFYLHLDKLWKKNNEKLISKKNDWQADNFFPGGTWKFLTGVSHFSTRFSTSMCWHLFLGDPLRT